MPPSSKPRQTLLSAGSTLVSRNDDVIVGSVPDFGMNHSRLLPFCCTLGTVGTYGNFLLLPGRWTEAFDGKLYEGCGRGGATTYSAKVRFVATGPLDRSSQIGWFGGPADGFRPDGAGARRTGSIWGIFVEVRTRGDEHLSPLPGHAPTHAVVLSGVGCTPCILRVAIGE